MKTAFLMIALSAASVFAQSGPTPDCLSNLSVPASFTPNGDYENDVFFLIFPCEPTSFEIKIYDNWGNIVFESTQFTFRWTGDNTSGVAQPNGVYVYTMTYADQSQAYNVSGEITIVH